LLSPTAHFAHKCQARLKSLAWEKHSSLFVSDEGKKNIFLRMASEIELRPNLSHFIMVQFYNLFILYRVELS
jgi:hypothetical protein